MAKVLAAFVGTLAGKLIVGTVTMAATVGALHSAGAVDLPIMPDQDQPTEDHSGTGTDPGVTREDDTAESKRRKPGHQAEEDAGQGERPGERPSQGPAASHRSSTREYREKVQDWNDCVAATAQSEPSPRGLDPEAACGPKPHPADFGLGEDPGSTAGNGSERGASNGGKGGDIPDHAPVPDQAPVPDSVPAGSGTPKDQGSDPPGAGSGSANRGATASTEKPGKGNRPPDA